MIHEIFSKRGKKLPDVLIYSVPTALRNQVVLIWQEIFAELGSNYYRDEMFSRVVRILRKEYYELRLPSQSFPPQNAAEELTYFFLNEPEDSNRIIDVIEQSFLVLIELTTPDHLEMGVVQRAITELNGRFREHGVGYEFVEDRIIRKDSEFIHTQVVVPALSVLQLSDFRGANDEFMDAHRHYRQGDNKATLTFCLNSLESVMKIICDKQGWVYPTRPTASQLIDECLSNNLIPGYWQSHFQALQSLLKCGVPTGRNQLASHGQGQTPVSVPDHIVRFMLHQTAACIVFLGESYAMLTK